MRLEIGQTVRGNFVAGKVAKINHKPGFVQVAGVYYYPRGDGDMSLRNGEPWEIDVAASVFAGDSFKWGCWEIGDKVEW